MLSDVELARAAQNGDAASLGVLLERHDASLYALALRIIGRGPEAQDAVQDTFLIALSSIDRLREPEAVGGWLRGILRNVCLRRLRERRGEISLDERAQKNVEERSFEPSAEEYIDRLALREWVWAALYELPEVLRVTAMLRYFGSYSSYEEISAILDVPLGTVRRSTRWPPKTRRPGKRPGPPERSACRRRPCRHARPPAPLGPRPERRPSPEAPASSSRRAA